MSACSWLLALERLWVLFEELLLHISDLFEGARSWAGTAQLVIIAGMAIAQSLHALWSMVIGLLGKEQITPL